MPMPPESHRLRPDHFPTPFSAAQIRAGCPAGRTIRIREEAAGDEPTHRRIVFVEVDAAVAVQEFQPTDADGQPVGEPTLRRSSWLDLQRHASQPTDATSVREVGLDLPFGTFDCWLYTVLRPDAELRFWFAKELAGMPVQVEEWVSGALASRTLMVADSSPVGSALGGSRWGMPVEKDESASKSRG
jgi:hypothetical protein